MEPLLQITQVRNDNENQLAFHVTITQGADHISTEEDLLMHIKNSIPAKKGITSVEQLSPSTWKITSNKN